eukprot:TRINITY_DN5948_c0_g1_i1.p1 TRINITY_DN5948_c0_g1~~TRINITY_DN5948_c0_g1_i1.p1  ORF type:complete len:183 (+),score=46.65 TRINITY_DN5948_c0_g1_i1:128-676(+)
MIQLADEMSQWKSRSMLKKAEEILERLEKFRNERNLKGLIMMTVRPTSSQINVDYEILIRYLLSHVLEKQDRWSDAEVHRNIIYQAMIKQNGEKTLETQTFAIHLANNLFNDWKSSGVVEDGLKELGPSIIPHTTRNEDVKLRQAERVYEGAWKSYEEIQRQKKKKYRLRGRSSETAKAHRG